MSASKPRYRNISYLLIAVLCSLPFVFGSIYLSKLSEQVDTLPLDFYSGLRWAPEGKDLVFLHRPLRQSPPAETEIWRATGSEFRQVGTLAAELAWTLTKRHAGKWMLLRGEEAGESPKLVISDGAETIKELEVDAEWTLLASQGDGFFFHSLGEDLLFEQIVDVEEVPEIEASDPPESSPELSAETQTVQAPTRLGLKISQYDPEAEELEPVFTIPFSRQRDKPIVHLLRRSPDQRFLALVIQFGERASPGLWVYDSESRRLLWTRVRVSQTVHGLDWSTDSLRVALSDSEGVTILPNALGIESVRLEVSVANGLRPKWGAGTKLYLLNDHIIYSVEQDRGQAEPLFDTHSQHEGFDDLVLNAIDGRIAYSASPKGYRELFVRDLQSDQPLVQEAFPGSLKQKAQDTLVYQLGSAIRFAWNRWTGRG